MSAYYVSRETAPVHVWDGDDTEYIGTPRDEDEEPYYEPVGKPLCGKPAHNHRTDPMDAHAPSIKEFIQGFPADYVCPGCVLALERRHKLPESYRTDNLDEGISEYKTVQERSTDTSSTSHTVPIGTERSAVVDAAREALAEARESGWSADDVTLTVSPDVAERLSTGSIRMMDPSRSFDGVPVAEDAGLEPGGMDLSFDTVDVDLEIATGAAEAAIEKGVKDLRERMDADPITHPRLRGSPAYTGTCISLMPAKLSDGGTEVTVDDLSVFDGEIQLGQEYEVPFSAIGSVSEPED